MRRQLIQINQDLKNTILKKDVDVIVERKADSLQFHIDDYNYNSGKLLSITFFSDLTVKISGIKSTMNNLNLYISTTDCASVLGADSTETAYKKAVGIVERLLAHSYDERLGLLRPHENVSAKMQDIESDLSRMNFYIACLDSTFRE
ncbi:MAG: hypothetical protein KGH53_01875 [Candidatus Micrarchaeota archaeon]|nr:hypothetical protein [Candidatus Micrarchaeota archaeon]